MDIMRLFSALDREALFDRIDDNRYRSKETGQVWSEWEATLIMMAHRNAAKNKTSDNDV